MDLNSLTNELRNNNWNVHGVEIYKNNNLIFSYGDTKVKRYPIYSATKTILSLAVGMAVDAGKMDINKSVLSYVPKQFYSNLVTNQINRFKDITIKRLLTMSVCGFPFRPDGQSWLRSVLQYDVIPEKREFYYSNVSAYLVGVAVTEAINENVYDYLNRQLFSKLGIVNPPYLKCPDGYFYGATGMELTVSELSIIGSLLMNSGCYKGSHIVSESYIIDACSNKQINREGGYGYFIWKYRDGFSINGKWGQKCYILPNNNLMVTFLANMEDDSSLLTECMENYILNVEDSKGELYV